MILYCKECKFPRDFPDETFHFNKTMEEWSCKDGYDGIITSEDYLCQGCKASFRYILTGE
jgi:hypothetical protein